MKYLIYILSALLVIILSPVVHAGDINLCNWESSSLESGGNANVHDGDTVTYYREDGTDDVTITIIIDFGTIAHVSKVDIYCTAGAEPVFEQEIGTLSLYYEGAWHDVLSFSPRSAADTDSTGWDDVTQIKGYFYIQSSGLNPSTAILVNEIQAWGTDTDGDYQSIY